MQILIAAVILGALGLIFGAVIFVASKYLSVPTDPKRDAVRECLPGANCGGCGFAGCDSYADAIAAGNYDIDIHSPDGSGTSHYYFPAGKWYTIPYRSLLPKGAANLLVAGRCISATHAAQASIRIMPIVTTLGEAAGVAAAIAAKAGVGVKHADVQAIRAQLEKEGAFLG